MRVLAQVENGDRQFEIEISCNQEGSQTLRGGLGFFFLGWVWGAGVGRGRIPMKLPKFPLPQEVPNSTSILSHTVWPQFNFHVCK